MAEHIDMGEESLNGPVDTPGEPPGTPPDVMPDTITPTPNMETHAHHLHHAPGNKFWHYIYEFLMLFLAVFCGFLAENLREHYVEHEREAQYMASMREDIAKDTSMLSEAQKRALSVAVNIDSVLDIIQNARLDDGSVYILYRVNLRLLSNFRPAFTDRTSAQLKNSGSMRLIRKPEVADRIIDYWGKCDILISANALIEDYKFKAREKTYSIFDQKYYSEESGKVFVNQPHLKLMTTDHYLLTEFANRLSHLKGLVLNVYLPELKAQEARGISLMGLIKKEYRQE